jgi:hypothetical protein
MMMVTLGVVAAAVVPWVARGYYLTGSIIFPTTAAGVGVASTTALAEHPEYRGDFREHCVKTLWPEAADRLARHGIKDILGRPYSDYNWRFRSIRDEGLAYHIWREAGLAYIRENPGRYARTILGNCLGVWFRGMSVRMGQAGRAVFVPLMLLAIVGVVAEARSGARAGWVLLFVIAYYSVMSAPGVTFVRSSLEATPALLVLGARGLHAVAGVVVGVSVKRVSRM